MERQQELEVAQAYVDSLIKSNEEYNNIPAVCKLQESINSFDCDRGQLNKLCEEINYTQADWNTYKKLFEELRNSRDVVRELQSKRQECNDILGYGESRQKALFEKCFSLKFKLTEDKAISLEFWSLSPSQPDRPCSVTLDVNADGNWEVVQVNPVISGVQDILNGLNNTGNLTEFCRLVRQKFKEILQSD